MADGIHAILSEYPEATVGVSLRDLGPGLAFDLNADRVFHAASTMKVPVMIEVFRLSELGRLSLADSIPVANEFRSIVDGSPYSMDVGEDSDGDIYGSIGRNVTVGWLVDRMITVSSNLATNILIDLVKADSVQETIEQLGTRTMRVYRGVEDLKAYELGLNNTATSEDLATVLTAIARGNAVSEASDAAMVEILVGQQFNTMIPAGLPEGTKVAHKTGSITEIHHDAAIVYPADSEPYVLVILIEGIDDHARSAELGARLTTAIHGWLIEGS
jgi:beta-lactamase class A